MTPRDGDSTPVRARIFRAVLFGSVAALMLLSWPLWATSSGFPRVPLATGPWSATRRLDAPAACLAWLGLAGAAASTRWRPWAVAALGGFAYLFAGDQQRLQPWVYQGVVVGLALMLTRPADGLKLARWYVVGLYVHSGLSKLDVSFCRELGDLFLHVLLGPTGVDPGRWPTAWHHAATLAMPGGELLVGLGLAWPATRGVALAGALAMHATLVAILGPWALDHSPSVLAWNVSLAVENLILFAWIAPEMPAFAGLGRDAPTRLAALLMLGVVILPATERWGVWDAWPSHALYASHVGRVDVAVRDHAAAALPAPLRDHFLPADADGWRRLDPTGWSRAVRGVPTYPQGRAGLGLAEAIAARHPEVEPVRVVVLGHADRWTGRRDRLVLYGRDAIVEHGRRFLLGARPDLAADGDMTRPSPTGR